ncbi:MAG: Hsp33 family molecular chaperone HslO, partial [Burkholderiaceae bacterium]
MTELHKFIFDGLPVRGMVVRLTDAWVEILRRRAANPETGPYPPEVQNLLGEMTAAAVMMQANLKFNGALILQIFGDGPLKLAVVEVQADLAFRATAKVHGELPAGARLSDMVNLHNQARCAITLDPAERKPGQQPYQGVVPLSRRVFGAPEDRIEHMAEVLEHYMLQREQLDTTLVLAANSTVAAGLLLQRMPMQGLGNLSGTTERSNEDDIGKNEDYQRLALLAKSLTAEELLTLGVDTVLHRLFWQEKLLRFAPGSGETAPRFACSCSLERVTSMLKSLGQAEADSIIAERGKIDVG